MCKIILLTGHKPAELGKIIGKAWQAFAATERDGFGAVWVNGGGLGVARSSSPNIPTVALPDFCAGFGACDPLESDGGALLLHGRTATCGVCLENTHPMVSGGSALVHNGIVSSKTFHNVETTCDSELILHAHRQGGAQLVASEISGYYAYGFLSAKRGKTTLDVVRDSRAQLHVGKTEHGYVFATTKELIACMGGGYVSPFRENTVARFVNGEHKATSSFTPKAPDMALAEKADIAFDDYQRGHRGRQSALFEYPSTNLRRGGP